MENESTAGTNARKEQEHDDRFTNQKDKPETFVEFISGQQEQSKLGRNRVRGPPGPGALCGIGCLISLGVLILAPSLACIGANHNEPAWYYCGYGGMFYGGIGALVTLVIFLIVSISRGVAINKQRTVMGEMNLKNPEKMVRTITYRITGRAVNPSVIRYCPTCKQEGLDTDMGTCRECGSGYKNKAHVKPWVLCLAGIGLSIGANIGLNLIVNGWLETVDAASVSDRSFWSTTVGLIGMGVVFGLFCTWTVMQGSMFRIRRYLNDIWSMRADGGVVVAELVKRYLRPERHIVATLKRWAELGFFIDGAFDSIPDPTNPSNMIAVFRFTSVRLPLRAMDTITGITG